MPVAHPRPVSTVAELLAGLLREPGRPRLTWYGPDGERVELSGAVLDNWVSKTVNLLVEEFDAGPGVTVRIDLPPHWRSVIWALAAWRCGATVLTEGDDADVVVTDRPGEGPAGSVVAVALPALARTWLGDPLPSGAIDAAGAVMTYGDVIGWAPETDPARDALPGIPYGRLVATPEVPAGRRTLLTVPGRSGLVEFWSTTVGVLRDDGSLVLVAGDVSTERLDRITRSERVDGRLSPAE